MKIWLFQTTHAKLSLIWWSRVWRWKAVKRGWLRMPWQDEGSPVLWARGIGRPRPNPETPGWSTGPPWPDHWEKKKCS